ncbi:phage portal protein [Burkholderia multivorans]|uniref:phage portal protein n=1 Tax=Burkholderia multivorans TaxID=87883 RepID=UPI000A531FE6|nr:phage portal protein [Burkholderia multivorans]MCA8385354.1 phage portal protein [Burkholderia multivorans]
MGVLTVKKPTLTQRIASWSGDRVARMIWAGRLRKSPARETTAYARLMNLGSIRWQKDRPVFKATPSNLRMFSKTVYARRAINRVKNTIAGLRWEVGPKEGVELNAELQRQIDIVKACLEQPNNDDSFRTLIEQIVEDYLVAGAGVIEQELGGDESRPLWMWPVDALSVQIFSGWAGGKNEPRYFQTLGYGNVGGQQGIPLTNEQVIYIRKDPTTENPFGYGCLEVAFASINRQLGVAEYAGQMASNGQPENLIQFVGLDSNQLDRMREWWRNEIEGQGMTPLLGGQELKVHKLRGTDDNALYLKYQEFILREIAVAFEQSPHILGLMEHDNRATAEVAEDRDYQAIIIPTATNIAAHLTREAIQGRLGFSQIEFRFLGLDRDDEQMLMTIHTGYYKSNVLTPNEIREKLGREPSKSQWADMCAADVEIAKVAAKGVAQDLDKDLPAPKPKPAPPSQQDID